MYSIIDLSCFDDEEEIVFTYDAASLGDPTHLDPCPFADDLDDASTSCGSRSMLTEESGVPFAMASLKSIKIPKFINIVMEPVVNLLCLARFTPCGACATSYKSLTYP